MLAASVSYRLVVLSFDYMYLQWDLKGFGSTETFELQGPFAGLRFSVYETRRDAAREEL